MNTHKDYDSPHHSPYPYIILYGRLRLAGLDENAAYRVTTEVMRTTPQEEDNNHSDEIFEIALRCVKKISPIGHEHLEIINEYEKQRRVNRNIPPLVLVLEGASATGKSMLALTLAPEIVATRFLSTDTLRQILRTTHSQNEVPELFCHTYQAFKYRQVGPEYIHPAVRGFLAQYEIIKSYLRGTVKNIALEGATGLVEGVHIIPGEFHDNAGAVEILIEPGVETHKNMFLNKRSQTGLTTITKEYKTRIEEFEATRAIQNHMLKKAKEYDINIVHLKTYVQAAADIRIIIIEHLKHLIE